MNTANGSRPIAYRTLSFPSFAPIWLIILPPPLLCASHFLQRLKHQLANQRRPAGLGADLQNEELLRKKAEIERRREYERHLLEENRVRLLHPCALLGPPAWGRRM